MTDKELLEKAAHRFRVIAEDANRITTGNLPHNLPCLRGFALRAAESIERHLQEPVSEGVEEAIEQSFIYHENRGDDFRSDEQIETAYRYGFESGADWKEQQMMSKAIVREVKVDAGGYPYIDVTELYDYDKDMPLAKDGDKVKVIVIKEG